MTEALPDDDAKKGKKKKKVTLSSVWRWYLTSIDLSQLRSIDLNGHSLFSHWGHSPKKAILHSGLPLLSYSYYLLQLFSPIFISFLFISFYFCVFMLLLCFIISALYYLYIISFPKYFPYISKHVYFPISTNIYFPISLKTNPLSSLMYPLFCFFVISQVKKTTTKIQGALDEDQESQVINTFSIHIITVYFRSAVCLLPVKPEVCISWPEVPSIL